MKHKMVPAGIPLIALLLLASGSVFSQKIRLTAVEKIPSIITATLERLHKAGITSENASHMNVKKRFNTLLTRFDEQGRFGLILNVTDVSPGLMSKLSAMGGDVVMALPYSKLISVYVPIDKVEDVASLEEVLTVSPITHAMKNTGSVTSEGDSIHHAINVRTDLNATGDSIKVGVISDGCVSFAASRGSLDLPANFGMANFFFGNGNKTGSGDEGTAMMEIVHDLAPNASLYFYGAAHDPAGYVAMVDAIYRLVREKGCRIIVDDLFFADQPMFEDATNATRSYIAAAARWAVDTGVVYISAAGNFARGGLGNPTDRSHYQATYQDINPAPRVPPFCVKPLPNGPIPVGIAPAPPFDNLHNFDNSGGFDPGLQVTIPRYTGMGEPPHLTVVLEWNDRWGDQGGGAPEDYDLYLYDANLVNLLAWSTNFQSGMANQNPYEILQFTNSDTVPKITNIVINHCGLGVQPRLLGMYIMGCQEVEYHTAANSIWGQPGIAEAIAVGAVPYSNTSTIESYSSHGNYDVYFPAYQSRLKPDVVAIDGGLITGAGGFGNPDSGNMRFYGTSASAPHVAGMAALLLSSSPAMTPAQVRAKFHRTAIDLGPPGFDVTYGYGFVDIERTMLKVNTAIAASGPYTRSNSVNVPMFFATNDGYAVSNATVTGGVQPTQVNSTVTVTAGSPYANAGVTELGCPTLKRWYQLTQTGGTNGQFGAQVIAYVDESERNSAGVSSGDMRLIHWNGSYFEKLPELLPPRRVGDTWVVAASFPQASFSPFFVGYLTRGVDVTAASSDSGASNQTVTLSFPVTNTGNGWDTLKINTHDLRGWSVSATPGLSINASQLKTVNVSVTIGVSDSIGSKDSVWLVATSVSDTTIVDSALATVLKNNSAITRTYETLRGWNMVSVPQLADDWSKTAVFPTATSRTFAYAGTYVVKETLVLGGGYWVKFDSSDSFDITGFRVDRDTIPVEKGWNMIGSISTTIPVSTIGTIGTNVLSSFFGYDGNYFVADSIRSGYACWVKVDSAGKLVLSSGGINVPSRTAGHAGLSLEERQSFNFIQIIDAQGRAQILYFGKGIETQVGRFEFPPRPPVGSFDVRFSSGRMAEMYSDKAKQFSIEISSVSYPLTLTWELNPSQKGSFALSGGNGAAAFGSIRLEEKGSVTIANPKTTSLVLRVEEGMRVPTQFALHQNYPNPFNPTTTIQFDLPTPATVTLTINNTLGQEVAKLVDHEQMGEGRQGIDFDASRLSSGVYFYRIVAEGLHDPGLQTGGTFTAVRKMALVK
ncbi:MAG: S8 family serine peptidase [Ignavibacteria bacterium]|nr:S8 family serine peptidase [Ignavibacteria bacterium]